MISAACASVPMKVRASAALLGHPSFQRAFGGFEGIRVGKHGRIRLGSAADDVFFLDRVPRKGDALPRIWLTEAASEGEGRVFSAVYPSGPDACGLKAEELGERCFAEGLSSSAVGNLALRIACFQAAEICFLHAADRGSIHALVRLATIYREDLCCGGTWFARQNPGRVANQEGLRLLKRAAEQGIAEACWLLSEAEGQSRFWALRAVKLADDSSWEQGNAWLAMARALEAQAQDLGGIHAAFEAYNRAANALAFCNNSGNWHAKRFLAEARGGRLRTAQELTWA